MHLSCGFAALSALFSAVSSSSLNFNLSIDYPPSSPLQIRQNSYFNEHHYYWINGLQPIWTTPQRRDVPQELRDQIDRAIAAVINLPHYFWTGTLPPNQTRADSIQWRTRPRARLEGGITLEDALAGISMPEWTAQDAQAREIWTYASNAFANTTTGDAYVFRGEWWRSDSTFDNEEIHNLQANPSVPRIWEIRTHLSYQEPPTLLWGNNDQVASNSKLRYQTSVACTIHASHGEFYRQQSETTTNYAEASPLGFFYGGQRSATNPGAYTYSMVSDAARDRPSQSTMSNWVTTHTSFDARFPTETSTLPSDINIPGIGWVPYQTACPFAGNIENMGDLRLRTLPLGDSITYGTGNIPGREYSYRGPFKQLVLAPHSWGTSALARRATSNNVVDFIGSVRSGDVDDQANEGHPGAEIDAIKDYAEQDLSAKPNLILLLAGTNDINNGHTDGAPDRLMTLVDHLTTTLPEAVVLVGTIPQNGQSDKEVNANTYNDRVTQLLYQRLGDGQRALPVYMESLASVDEDFADLLHPSDVGYRKMADAWFSGLFQAFNLGLLREAEGDLEGDVPTGDYCTRVSAWYPYGQMASGTRYTPACGVYDCHTDPDVSSSGCFCTMTEPNLETPVQFVPPPKSGLGPLGCADMNDNSSSVRFADLNGDGRAEYIYIDVHGTTDAWMNFWVDNKVGWQDSGEIASGVGARRHQIHFADINGDGRADYLYVHDDGAVEAWLNVPGPDDGPTLSLGWNPLGIIATGVGKDGAGVRFADLNGDGRAEYIYLYDSGAADAWLNLGPQDGQSQYGWWPQGQVASGPFNGATRDNIIFADINGDGRDDYLTVTHTGGAVEAWYNAGSRTPGGLLDANVGWWPQGVIATGVGTSGAGVTFADIDGDGRAEYIDVSYYSGAANMWVNECPIA